MIEVEATCTDEDYHALESFLSTKLQEFNAAVTGVKDAQYLGLRIENPNDEVVAGVAGHTWNGTCFIGYVWVSENARRKGYGRRLIQAVEEAALKRNCRNIVLSTHSFQSPGFYEQMGFVKSAEVVDHPTGYSNIWYTKKVENGI